MHKILPELVLSTLDDKILDMKRRSFIRDIALGTAGLLSGKSSLATSNQRSDQASAVKQVLVMFKCHFDCGFIDTQAGVIRKYFEEYYPKAIDIAQSMRQAGGDRYVWTTGSWLLYRYLEQANHESRKRMEEAISAGHIAWHALPFSWQTELLDRSMIRGAIGFSKALDRRFGHVTTGAKMTDVPGHSRGLIGPLAESGVKFLDIGVNSASTPPDVPSIFLWKDPDGATLVMMYHRTAYGGVVQVPGSDLAMAVEVRNDNSGPHQPHEIIEIFARLRQQFPNATVTASNLTDIANAVDAYRNQLPVFTQEIGDTWIYGVPSDPVKVARYREVVRLRREWIGQGRFKPGDTTDLALLQWFSLAAEHTWGTDTKTWLDFDHYTPHDLAEMLPTPKYQTVATSWVEKRNDIDQGIAALPAALSGEARTRLTQLKPAEPATGGLEHRNPEVPFHTAHFSVALNAASGAIHHLRNKQTGREWASAQHPLALFTYQMLSKADYDRFLATYITVQTDWAPKDFGKPNIEHFGAESRSWSPKITRCWSGNGGDADRLIAELHIDDIKSLHAGRVAWPEKMYLELTFPANDPAIHIDFFWFGKTRNRMPEAMWFTFQPNALETRNWTLDKVERPVSPFDVVTGGNRHMHALSAGLTYRDSQGMLSIETLDAPVVALGERSPIYFSNSEPDLSKGIHFSLFNNAWGTNYIQWFGDDMRFRFILKA